MKQYGLGALPSPADPRDWQLPLDMAAPLPSKYYAAGMPPVLNQGTSPMCVAFSSASVRMWQERPDAGRFVDFDPAWLYYRAQAIDGIPGPHDGTTIRAAMKVLAAAGLAPKAAPAQADHYRIASYYAVPFQPEALKAAILQYGPINVATSWARSWMRPPMVNGAYVLPPFDSPIGGHATVLYGWDDAIGGGAFYLRNSWGRGWCGTGNVYAPYARFVPRMHDAWKSLDIKGDSK